VPLFHEASISLELIDLNAAHFLLPHGGNLHILVVKTVSEGCLTILLPIKLHQVRLHVQLLLGLVERIDALLEKFVLDFVILFL